MRSKYFYTNDHVKLHYIDEGQGKAIILLHGWSQSAHLFENQINFLKEDYRVLALDMRGHGLSAKPEKGYKIARLAKDLDEFIKCLGLEDVIILGHSMGASVLFCYWELFNKEKISKMILVDQQAYMLINPKESKLSLKEAGASFSYEKLFSFVNALTEKRGALFSADFIRSRFTPKADQELVNKVIQQNLLMPRAYAAELFLNHASQDWRSVIPQIDVATLIISAELGGKSLESQKWIHEKIEKSRFELFTASEGGGHFMFLENPQKFNCILKEFLQNKFA